ncbi:MAG TPA: condensation domain-containing protein [Trebonia sp.]
MSQSKIVVESVGQYPLTSRQRDPSGLARTPEHVVALTLRIKGEMRVECLKDALGDVVERHEALRTRLTYSETDGTVGFQEVLPPMPVPLAVQELAVSPGRPRDDMAVELLNKSNEEGLSFSALPSLHACLYRFDDHDAVLTILIHHLRGDGWSADIVRREIAACYRARVSGTPHGLPAPVPYREFATWEQDFLQGEKGAAARRFWAGNLAGAQLCALPADRLHGPSTLTEHSAVGNFSIDPGDFAKVTASAARNRCSFWHVLLAAIMVLAERAVGQTDITLLTISSGRPSRDFYDTVGLFADLVPVRLEFGDCTSARDLMRLARNASAEALQHQVPFGTILEMVPDLLKKVDDPRGVVPGFNYIPTSVVKDDSNFLIGVELVMPPEELPGKFLRGAFKWNFRVAESGEFRCTVEYEPDAIDASTIDRWGSDLLGLVLAIADRPDQEWKNLQPISGVGA